MAEVIDPILIRIQADVNDLKVGLAQAQSGLKGIDDHVKTASTGMSNFVGKLKQVGATIGVAFASQQIVQFGKDVIAAASDMNETVSKTQVIFGDAYGTIEKFASTASTQMGMSKKEALDASSTFALFGKSAGLAGEDVAQFAAKHTQLASDFASFYNTSPQDAIQAIGAAFRGEMEPIRRYNVLLDDASLRQEAVRMGITKTTSEALTPQQKVLAASNLIFQKSTEAQGDFARTADGVANKQRTLTAQFKDTQASIGSGLLPVYNVLLEVLQKGILPVFEKLGKFLSDNKEAVLVFTGVLTAGALAWGVYTLAVNASTIATRIWTAVTKANPIGLLVTAVALLAAGFVAAWNKSETFRKVVIEIGKAGVTAFAFLIKVVGDLVTALMNLVTGPLQLMLKGLKLLGVKQAGSALEEIQNAIKTTGKFFDDAAKKVEGYKSKLDSLAKTKISFGKSGGSTASAGTTTPTPGVDTKAIEAATKAEQKRLDDLKEYLKDVQDIYDDMNKVIANAAEDYLEASKKRDEAIADANKRYAERTAELQKNYDETVAEARQRNAETIASIQKDYSEKVVNIEKTLQEKITDLRQKAADKSAELVKQAADKQTAIVQESIDRLRNAFASKTGFDIAESFKENKSADALLNDLKDKLQSAKDLQTNAATLAGMGYSQTFIEQVVKNGPETGNAIAEALKNASPEATQQMQDLYAQVETVSNHGLDALANSMNTGGKLATEQLTNAYAQVPIDLAKSLADVDAQLTKDLAEAQKTYSEAMAEAKKVRDEGLAEAQKTLDEALLNAKKALDEGLAAAQKDLQEAILEANKNFAEAVDKINKNTQAKMDELKKKLAEVAALIAALGAAEAAANAIASAPVYKPYAGGTSSNNIVGGNTNINTTYVSNGGASATDVQNGVLSAYKYGQAVTTGGSVNTTTLAGIMAASGFSTSSINTQQGVLNKVKGLVAE